MKRTTSAPAAALAGLAAGLALGAMLGFAQGGRPEHVLTAGPEGSAVLWRVSGGNVTHIRNIPNPDPPPVTFSTTVIDQRSGAGGDAALWKRSGGTVEYLDTYQRVKGQRR